MQILFKILLYPLVAVLSLGGYHFVPNNAPVAQYAGIYNPTGGGTYRLQGSVSSSQSTITLTSFKEPVSGTAYTMTYLNSSIEYATIEPSNNTNKEFVSFTGITQNTDGTATLTGVTRGLGFSYPYTSSATLQLPHAGQSIFILSNPPQLTNQYANKNNNESISGQWDFSTLLPTSSITATTSNQFATKAYADNVIAGGAPTSTELIGGKVRLATQNQMASTTYTSADDPAALYARYSTSTKPVGTSNLKYVPVTNSIGFLDQSFQNLTIPWTYTGGLSSTGTTTISASSTTTNPLKLNGVAYQFPSTRAASSSVLEEDGGGKLQWINEWHVVTEATFSGVATATISNIATSSDLHLVLYGVQSGANCGASMNFNNDSNTVYDWKQFFNYTTADTQSGGGAISLFSRGGANGLPSNYFVIDIGNSGSMNKMVSFSGNSSDAVGTVIPIVGQGFWRNTTTTINRIDIGAGKSGCTWNAGTRITVYGR